MAAGSSQTLHPLAREQPSAAKETSNQSPRHCASRLSHTARQPWSHKGAGHKGAQHKAQSWLTLATPWYLSATKYCIGSHPAPQHATPRREAGSAGLAGLESRDRRTCLPVAVVVAPKHGGQSLPLPVTHPHPALHLLPTLLLSSACCPARPSPPVCPRLHEPLQALGKAEMQVASGRKDTRCPESRQQG